MLLQVNEFKAFVSCHGSRSKSPYLYIVLPSRFKRYVYAHAEMTGPDEFGLTLSRNPGSHKNKLLDDENAFPNNTEKHFYFQKALSTLPFEIDIELKQDKINFLQIGSVDHVDDVLMIKFTKQYIGLKNPLRPTGRILRPAGENQDGDTTKGTQVVVSTTQPTSESSVPDEKYITGPQNLGLYIGHSTHNTDLPILSVYGLEWMFKKRFQPQFVAEDRILLTVDDSLDKVKFALSNTGKIYGKKALSKTDIGIIKQIPDHRFRLYIKNYEELQEDGLVEIQIDTEKSKCKFFRKSVGESLQPVLADENWRPTNSLPATTSNPQKVMEISTNTNLAKLSDSQLLELITEAHREFAGRSQDIQTKLKLFDDMIAMVNRT